MATVVGAHSCANADCRVAETSKCVEGLALEQCPHYGRQTALAAVAPDSGTAGVDIAGARKRVVLPSAERLATREAASLLRAGEARVVALVAPSDAGKTTLIASLYDLFQNAGLDEFRFARSRTLRAFEQACHDARAASRRTQPQTEHTPLGDVKFFHLGLFDQSAATVLDFLLADRAGEYYRSASDDPAVATTFVEIARADVITVLVDGRRLLDLGARHNVRSEIELMLQGLIDGDALIQAPRLATVLTKLDLLEESPHKARAEDDFQSLVQSVRRLFGTAFGAAESFRVAASPATDVLPRGHGLAALLRFWAMQLPRLVPRAANAAASLSQRAIGRLAALES